jgi:uncharacterized protein
MQNPFAWHDLMTSDVEAAKTFYGKVVGWEFTHQPPAYSVANVGGKGIGGIMDIPAEAKGMSPFWSGYVYTLNVDETCERVTKLGGKIFRAPWDVPGVIRMAVIIDPTGAALNLMHPLSQGDGGFTEPGALGTVAWNELLSTDPEAATEFYSKLLGWTKGEGTDMPGIGFYQVMQINGRDAVGIMKKPDDMPMSFWGYYFLVEGIDAGASRIKGNGGTVLFGPVEVPGGQWIVTGTDPQGAFFSLMSNTK